jgi:hypothetical protein
MNRRCLLVLLAPGALGACGATPDSGPADAAADASIAAADAGLNGRWTTAEPIVELASPTDERFGSLTGDGLVIYFTRTEMIGSFVVNVPYAAGRASVDLPFGDPLRPVAWGASSIYDQDHAADNLEWFFWRGLGQLGTSARAAIGDPWSFPIDLAVDGFSPSISGDGRSLYFVDFNGELAVMARDGRGEPWSPPALVPVAGEIGIARIDVSADELSLLISAQPGSPEAGVYIAERLSRADGFGEPQLIDALAGPYEAPRFRADELEIVCELQLGGDRNLYRSRYVIEK